MERRTSNDASVTSLAENINKTVPNEKIQDEILMHWLEENVESDCEITAKILDSDQNISVSATSSKLTEADEASDEYSYLDKCEVKSSWSML